MKRAQREVAFSSAQIDAYAEASGDHNPIHRDEEFARSVGLPGVIAHGMLQMGILATVASEAAGVLLPVCRHGRAWRHGHIRGRGNGTWQADSDGGQPTWRSGPD